MDWNKVVTQLGKDSRVHFDIANKYLADENPQGAQIYIVISEILLALHNALANGLGTYHPVDLPDARDR